MEKPFSAYEGDGPYVFVCYAHEDAASVYPELTWLREQGINVWYDEGISAGANWRAAIGDSLLGASKVLFYVSPGAVASDHCNREVNLALDEGLEILPIYLTPTTLTTDLRIGLSRVQALDAEDSGYRDRLLRALGAAPGETTSSAVKPGSTGSSPAKWLLVAGLIAVAAGAAWWLWPVKGGEPAGPGRAIVVIPFANLSPDPADEYLADGLSEELILVLEQIPGLTVASRTASFYYKLHPEALSVIGEKLGVSHALEGSVRRSGDTVRVAARLVRTEDGATVFREEFQREVGDLIDLQTELALVIVNALAMDLSERDLRATATIGTESEAAFDLYLRAMDHFRQDNADDLRKAEGLMRAAIDEDPTFIRAYMNLGSILMQAAGRTGEFQVYHQRVRDLQHRLEEQFPDRPADHPSRAVLRVLDRDWPGLERSLAERIRQDPDDPALYQYYAYHLANAGLFEEALAYSLRASELDPFDLRSIEIMADMHLRLGRSEEALAEFRRCLFIAPGRTGCFDMVGQVLMRMGMGEEARQHFGDNLSPMRACAYGWDEDCGDLVDSRFPAFAGHVALGFDDLDEAFERYEKAVEINDTFINQIRWQAPEPAKLEGDPRYADLLARLGLDDEWQRELCLRASGLTRVTRIPVSCQALDSAR